MNKEDILSIVPLLPAQQFMLSASLKGKPSEYIQQLVFEVRDTNFEKIPEKVENKEEDIEEIVDEKGNIKRSDIPKSIKKSLLSRILFISLTNLCKIRLIIAVLGIPVEVQ